MVFSIFTDTCNYHHNQFSLCPKAISCCSVTQSCLTLCSLMDCRMSGFPVLHHLPESAQTHVHWISDVIQPSHPLSSLSPPSFNRAQHQGLFQWVGSSHQVTKVLEPQLQHQSFQWIVSVDFPLGMTGLISVFPGGSDGKTSAYNTGDLGLIPGLGRSPGEGNGNPLQYSCLENPMDGGTW